MESRALLLARSCGARPGAQGRTGTRNPDWREDAQFEAI